MIQCNISWHIVIHRDNTKTKTTINRQSTINNQQSIGDDKDDGKNKKSNECHHCFFLLHEENKNSDDIDEGQQPERPLKLSIFTFCEDRGSIKVFLKRRGLIEVLRELYHRYNSRKILLKPETAFKILRELYQRYNSRRNSHLVFSNCEVKKLSSQKIEKTSRMLFCLLSFSLLSLSSSRRR